jgi:hypothetical protein
MKQKTALTVSMAVNALFVVLLLAFWFWPSSFIQPLDYAIGNKAYDRMCIWFEKNQPDSYDEKDEKTGITLRQVCETIKK